MSWLESRPGLYVLLLSNLGLLVFGLYFLQEGLAHLANPGLEFFVDFPGWLTYLAGAATVILIPNLAVMYFTFRRNLPIRRWTWVTTLVSAVLLVIVTAVVGPSETLTIINPAW